MFVFNDTTTTEISTLSLHDALPIWRRLERERAARARVRVGALRLRGRELRADRGRDGGDVQAGGRGCGFARDRKSTRLNSSHANISYAVFCLKKKNQN